MRKRKWTEKLVTCGGLRLHTLEIKNDLPPLLLLHAQGTNAESFSGCFAALARHFHLYALDCPGHGQSEKDSAAYTLPVIGAAVEEFLSREIAAPAALLGHSSGGLIAAYVAAQSPLCRRLILEDPPFFSSQGARRFAAYNYLDLSTVCHTYLQTGSTEDFVLYYFARQKMWELFPEKSREKIRAKLQKSAAKYRAKHPQSSLKVPFFPKMALAAYQGMQDYDPHFGEAFYSDSFHGGVEHEQLLRGISCKTLLMKAKTNYEAAGEILFAAMSEEDAARVCQCIPDCRMQRFACGHGIHIEKKKEFVQAIVAFAGI